MPTAFLPALPPCIKNGLPSVLSGRADCVLLLLLLLLVSGVVTALAAVVAWPSIVVCCGSVVVLDSALPVDAELGTAAGREFVTLRESMVVETGPPTVTVVAVTAYVVSVEPCPDTEEAVAELLEPRCSVTVSVPRETTAFVPTVPGYATTTVEPPVVAVTVTVVGDGAEIVTVVVCMADKLLARPSAFAMAPEARGTPRKEQPSSRGVSSTLTSREGSQLPFMQVMRSGRKRPLLSRQMHLRSVSGQLPSVDWSMHWEMHCGTFSCADARDRQRRRAKARIREMLEESIVLAGFD